MNGFSVTEKLVFRHTPISTQVFSPDGKSLYANKAWEKLWNVRHKKIEGYNILKDKQLINKGIMPYIKRGFRGEIVNLPTVKYEPSKTMKIKGTVPYRLVKALIYPVKNQKGEIEHVVLQHEDITDEIYSKEKLQLQGNILGNITNSVITTDLKGKITYWNKGARQIFGYTEQEMLGKDPEILYPHINSKQLKKDLELVLKGKDYIGEWQGRRKDGKNIWVSIKTSILKDLDGKAIGFIGVANDITKRKEIEIELELEKRQSEFILKNIRDGITVQDKNGNILFANDSAAKLLGFKSASEILSTPTIKIMEKFTLLDESGGLFDSSQLPGRLALQGNYPKPQILRFLVNSTKEERWSMVSAAPVFDKHRNVIYAVNVIRDITEFVKAEEETKRSEERFRLALDAGKIGVWDWHIKRNKITWTDRLYEIHGLKKNKFGGTIEAYKKLIYPDDLKLVDEKLQNALKGGEPYQLEFRAYGPNKKIVWIFTSAKVIFDENGKPVRMLGAAIDITKRKKLEEQKDEFISLASHELKTPVTSLKAYAQVLRRKFEKKGDTLTAGLFEKMDSQINKLTMLIGDLLDSTRIHEGRLELRNEEFEINALIEDVVEDIQRTTDKHTIRTKLLKPVIIYGDRERYAQVLTNLLTNAIKYSPKSKYVDVLTKMNKNMVLVSIKDYGVGIPKENMGHLFTRFFRVENSVTDTYPGLGLGLYISREIITRQNGKIWVESKEGYGSTFTFSIPLIKKLK